MKNKICIIGIYFGKFPSYFELWLKSCRQNPKIDFLIFTDNEYAGKTIENVRFLASSLNDVKQLFEKKLQMKISLERPYKLCDFKPAYGFLFEEYLSGYEYWGHCDFDMLFGDVLEFLEKYDYKKYDKFLPLGHLCLYRNVEKCNEYFRLDGGTDYREAFQNPQSAFFDEHKGMDLICKKHKIPYFQERIFADISRLYRRFRLALDDVNYDHQIFFWENGKTYRAYLKDNVIHTEEYMYIHFSMRSFEKEKFPAESVSAFFVGPEGFSVKTPGNLTESDILNYNKFPGRLSETLEVKKTRFFIKVKRLKKKIGVR